MYEMGYGFMFPAGDTEDLANHIAQLLSDNALRAEIGNAGAEYARTTVDWNILVPKIRAVYRRAIESK